MQAVTQDRLGKGLQLALNLPSPRRFQNPAGRPCRKTVMTLQRGSHDNMVVPNEQQFAVEGLVCGLLGIARNVVPWSVSRGDRKSTRESTAASRLATKYIELEWIHHRERFSRPGCLPVRIAWSTSSGGECTRLGRCYRFRSAILLTSRITVPLRPKLSFVARKTGILDRKPFANWPS